MRVIILVLLSVIGFNSAFAQNTGTPTLRKHLIYFKDKANSPFATADPRLFLSEKALSRRGRQAISVNSRDWPVNPTYVAGIRSKGIQVWYTSRWFNAAVLFCDSTQLAEVLKLPFVRAGQTLSRLAPVKPASGNGSGVPVADAPAQRQSNERKNYGRAFNQAEMLGAIDLHNSGFRGEGMNVAVFDGGFPGVNQIPAFNHLFSENRLKGTFDFVGRDPGVFERDNHGTNVLSTMAAHAPGIFIGTAYKANYFLFITEDSQGEQQIEEINWLLAAEFADSAGVDVINSSLGYNDFDAPSRDYTYADMDGNTALVTRAADFAAAAGILVVNSAGNEGNKPWRYIGAPADADSVLTVGAVDSLGRYAAFSSVGPTADGRLKPNLVAQGIHSTILSRVGQLATGHGTSFASPILAGMAACFWQSNPDLTNMEVIEALQRSASKANNPDQLLGYGIPNGFKAYQKSQEEKKKTFLYPNPARSGGIKLKVGEGLQDQRLTVTVFNMIAQKVYSQTFNTTRNDQALDLDISHLHPGIYGCLVTGASGKQSLKFLKL